MLLHSMFRLHIILFYLTTFAMASWYMSNSYKSWTRTPERDWGTSNEDFIRVVGDAAKDFYNNRPTAVKELFKWQYFSNYRIRFVSESSDPTTLIMYLRYITSHNYMYTMEIAFRSSMSDEDIIAKYKQKLKDAGWQLHCLANVEEGTKF
jgi:hypothetical protein